MENSKIKNAWGQYYEDVKEYLDDDGWCTAGNLFANIFTKDESQWDTQVNPEVREDFEFRPKLLIN